MEDLKEEIEDIIEMKENPSLPPLIWSQELAKSAADYLTQIEGSRVIPGLSWREYSSVDFVDQYVSYKSHKRIALVPWKFFWVSSLETIYDLILDDYDPTHPAREALLHSNMTHIGIACNCHPRLGQVCVFELAEHPVVKSVPEYAWELNYVPPEEELEDCAEICLNNPPNHEAFEHCCEVVCNRPNHLGDEDKCEESNPFPELVSERRGRELQILPNFKKPFDETCEGPAYWSMEVLPKGWMPPAIRSEDEFRNLQETEEIMPNMQEVADQLFD